MDNAIFWGVVIIAASSVVSLTAAFMTMSAASVLSTAEEKRLLNDEAQKRELERIRKLLMSRRSF